MKQSRRAAMLWVGMVAAVLWRRFVREDLVVSHVVEVHTVACWTANDRRVDAKIADQSSHRDVHYIVAKTATVWPAAGNNAIAKARLDLADQSVAAKDAQAGEARVIRVGTLLSAIACQPARVGGQINFNQIGNKNSRDVSPTCLNVRQRAIEDNYVDQVRQFGSYRVSSEQRIINLGAGAAVAILIGDGDQTLVEQRVALTCDLHPPTEPLRIAILAQDLYLTAAGGCIETNNLLVTAQFAHRNHERHEVNVEPALGILARRTKLQEIEYGQDVGIETIVTLPCEREVTAAQVLDCLGGVPIQLSFRRDAVLRGIVAVVALIIKRSCNSLAVGRYGAR